MKNILLWNYKLHIIQKVFLVVGVFVIFVAYPKLKARKTVCLDDAHI